MYIRIIRLFINLYHSIEFTIVVENLDWDIFFLQLFSLLSMFDTLQANGLSILYKKDEYSVFTHISQKHDRFVYHGADRFDDAIY